MFIIIIMDHSTIKNQSGPLCSRKSVNYRALACCVLITISHKKNTTSPIYFFPICLDLLKQIWNLRKVVGQAILSNVWDIVRVAARLSISRAKDLFRIISSHLAPKTLGTCPARPSSFSTDVTSITLKSWHQKTRSLQTAKWTETVPVNKRYISLCFP